jgi:hypothetical protein
VTQKKIAMTDQAHLQIHPRTADDGHKLHPCGIFYVLLRNQNLRTFIFGTRVLRARPRRLSSIPGGVRVEFFYPISHRNPQYKMGKGGIDLLVTINER